MTTAELKEIVEQNMESSEIVGRLVCNLHSNDAIQRHKDGRDLAIYWSNKGSYWRFTTFVDEESELALAQIDLHTDGTVRFEAHEPCSLTVAPEDGIVCLTRFRPLLHP